MIHYKDKDPTAIDGDKPHTAKAISGFRGTMRVTRNIQAEPGSSKVFVCCLKTLGVASLPKNQDSGWKHGSPSLMC